MTVSPLALEPALPVFTTTMVVEPPDMPPVADIGRFEVAMSAPRLTVDQVQAPELAEPATGAATPAALGERILERMEQMRTSYKAGMTRVDATMHKEDVRLPDFMRLLVDTMQMSIQQDMLSKMVGRTTQNLDQLLKGQ